MSKNKKGYPFLIIGGAIVLLVALSLVPWSDLTGGRIKDFNLLSDLFPGSVKTTGEENIDPELAAALGAGKDANALEVEIPDTVTRIRMTKILEGKDSISLHEVIEPKEPVHNVNADGMVIIEDYTVGEVGLKNLKSALAQVDNRPVRIAVIGDSYIEGDILTMNIREALQNKYGGAGVGYMPVSSELTGFRTTVRQTCSGWTKHEIRKDTRSGMKTLPGEYFTSQGSGKSTFKGVGTLANLDQWNQTTVLAVAPSGGKIIVNTDNDADTLDMEAEDVVKALTLNGTTTSATVKATGGVEIAGVYLNNNNGVCIDNMSLRGNSGQTHRKLSVERAAQMRQYVDYDLIIVEYGINALSSSQSDYSGYQKLMMQTISRLKECYPNADIIMLGIGDRGQKAGSEVKSISTSENMVKAQRDAARLTGVLFWDTRKAMGGENSVLKWRADGMINPDYIHLNQKGGRELARIFVNSLYNSL